MQAFGNVLRAARYGSGRRGQIGRVLIGLMAVLLVLLLVSSVVTLF